MKIISYISELIVPVVISFIVFVGFYEKKNVFNLFSDGVKEGIKIIIKIFPTLIGIMLAISMLSGSKSIDVIGNILKPILQNVGIPAEILPLVIVRPISGSAALGMASEIMSKYGVDSYIGKVASVIMGSTETTIYTIAIYSSVVKQKNNKDILIAGLCADAVGIASSIVFCRILSNGFC